MDELRDYQHRRLDLADSLRSALNVARSAHDDEIEAQLRSLLRRLAEDRFTLAVIGQFSRGKSTLMNAILGNAYLPSGVLPMTSVITTVRYGSAARATYLRRGSTTRIAVGLSDIPELVAQSSGRRAELQVAQVDIELPAEILRLGFAFVDTPGIGSAIGANSASTRHFLPEADAAVFVTTFDSALTSAEVELLRELGRQRTELFCVINKRDLVDQRTAAEVSSFVQHTLRNILSGDEPRIFAVSALDGLTGKLESDPDRSARSGLSRLEESLESFLTTQKSTLLLRNVSRRASNVIARQQRDLRLGLLKTDRTLGSASVSTAFSDAMSELHAKQQALASEICDRVSSDLPDRLATHTFAWKEDLRSRLSSRIEAALSALDEQLTTTTQDDRERIRHELQTVTAQAVQDWIAQRCAEVTETMTDIAADQIGELIESSRSPNRVGVALAGMLMSEDTEIDAGWTSADVPLIAVPRVDWQLRLDHGARLHLRQNTRDHEFRRYLPVALDHAIEDAEPRVRLGFVQLIEHWTRDLLADIERRTERGATRFQHNLHALPSAEDLNVLSDLLSQLDEFRTNLPAHPEAIPAHDSEGERPVKPKAETKDCAICTRLTETLFGYLSKRQFLLATREHDQADLAESNGFCPLHTWAYHALASPLGISAGYARLAEATAQTLEKASANATDTRNLGRAVDELVVNHDRCPLCRRLADAESEAAAHYAQPTTDPDDVPALCVDHMAKVLEAGPPLERAHTMVRTLAAQLRRNAEDMRSYALKREALDRGLLTDEETRAHLNTLRLLAGDAALARSSIEDKELSFGGD